jgi:hypothetical protein
VISVHYSRFPIPSGKLYQRTAKYFMATVLFGALLIASIFTISVRSPTVGPLYDAFKHSMSDCVRIITRSATKDSILKTAVVKLSRRNARHDKVSSEVPLLQGFGSLKVILEALDSIVKEEAIGNRSKKDALQFKLDSSLRRINVFANVLEEVF